MNVSWPLPAVAAVLLVVTLLMAPACGTLQIGIEVPQDTEPTLPPVTQPVAPATSPPPETVPATPTDYQRAPVEAIAWYGEVHSVDRADPGYDYLKLWHLHLWPKFGRAVGLAGADPAVNAEIERIRDRDVRAHFWGTLICDVGDYGACQLMVTRLSANDGGPTFIPDPVNGWQGTIGRLPGEPGSQKASLYFALTGEVPILYGITSQDPSIQFELERLRDSRSIVRIWGDLHSRVHPVTGSQIIVNRLQLVSAALAP